jgi:hypothetical protein
MKHRQLDNNNWNIARKIILFSVTTLIIGLIAYFIIMGLFRMYSFNISGEEKWNLLDGFVGVISLSLLVGGLTYAAVDRIRAEYAEKRAQDAEERDKAKLSYDIYQAIFDKLTDPEQEAARRWILLNIPIKKDSEDTEAWYQRMQARIMEHAAGDGSELPEGQRYIKQTLNCFDYIGFIANNYWEIKEDSLDWLSPPIAKVWRRIGPYVMHVRTLRGAKDYYVSAEYIGNLCIKWRKDRGLPDEEYVEKTP